MGTCMDIFSYVIYVIIYVTPAYLKEDRIFSEVMYQHKVEKAS